MSRTDPIVCVHCDTNEARCAWVQGCCPKCSHTFGLRARQVTPPAPAQVVRLVRVPSPPPPRPSQPEPHALDFTDPLDRLYLELLPRRPSPPQMGAAELAALVGEVCPSTTRKAWLLPVTAEGEVA